MMTTEGNQRLAMLGLRVIAPLTWKERVLILHDIFRALSFLHTRSDSKPVILHRDVKPSNILLDSQGTALLADCGLAKSQGRAGTRTTHMSTQLGTLGTPGFLDPLITNSMQHSECTLAWWLNDRSTLAASRFPYLHAPTLLTSRLHATTLRLDSLSSRLSDRRLRAGYHFTHVPHRSAGRWAQR